MAQLVNQVVAPSSGQTLLWQTSTGMKSSLGAQEDAAINPTGGIVRAGTVNDPVPIIITNQDAANTCYIGGSGVTGPTNGTPLVAGGSLTRNVVGNDSEYVAGDGNAVDVSVEFGRQ